jgi:hypothetical protein
MPTGNNHKKKIASYLVEAARYAPSADNSQPCLFRWDGNGLLVSFAHSTSKKPFFGPIAHATLLSLGAVVENLEQAAEASGLTLKWEWSDNADGAPYARVGFSSELQTPVLQSALSLLARHTNRFPFLRTPLPDSVLQEVATKSEGDVRALAIGRGLKHQSLVHWARVASEVRFCTRDLHAWLVDSLRMTADEVGRGDGLDLATLSLPPGGSYFMRFISDWGRMQFLNRFGAYKALALVETQLLGASPLIVCIVGKTGRDDVIRAGRLMQRIWVELNEKGYAVHPYYVITDQLTRLSAGGVPIRMLGKVQEMASKLPSVLGARPGETLHMMLRVGLPTVNPPRSRRLPLERIFEDLPTSETVADF